MDDIDIKKSILFFSWLRAKSRMTQNYHVRLCKRTQQ